MGRVWDVVVSPRRFFSICKSQVSIPQDPHHSAEMRAPHHTLAFQDALCRRPSPRRGPRRHGLHPAAAVRPASHARTSPRVRHKKAVLRRLSSRMTTTTASPRRLSTIGRRLREGDKITKYNQGRRLQKRAHGRLRPKPATRDRGGAIRDGGGQRELRDRERSAGPRPLKTQCHTVLETRLAAYFLARRKRGPRTNSELKTGN